jgi:hypothetical protein
MQERSKLLSNILKYKLALASILVFVGVAYAATNFKDINVNGEAVISGGVTAGQINNNSFTDFVQQTTPANPAVNHNRLYFKNDDFLYRLDSTGTESLVGSAASGVSGAIQFSDGAGGLSSDASNLFWNDGSNRLGIGTNTPAYILDVVTTPGNYSRLMYDGALAVVAASDGTIGYLGTNTNHPVEIIVNDSAVMKFDTDGNIRTGDGIADAKFHISSAGGSLNAHLLMQGSGGSVGFTSGSLAGNTIYSFPNDGSSGQFLRTDGSGNLTWATAASSTGINMLSGFNHNAELGSTTFWSQTGGGAFTVTSTAADVGNGTYAFSFDASAASDFATSDSRMVPAGLFGANCLLEFYYKGFDSNIAVQVYDGTNVIASENLVASTNYTKKQINFICPSSGGLQVRFFATANAAIGFWDEVHLGSGLNISNVSQAGFVGSAYFAETANCLWSRTNTAVGAFSTDTDCPAPTVSSNPGPGTIQTTDADLPQITVNDLPPGRYMVIASGEFHTDTGSTGISGALFDGVTTTGHTSCFNLSGSNTTCPLTVIANFTYTSSGDRTFAIHGAAQANSVQINNNANVNGRRTTFTIYRFPNDSQEAIDLESQPWRVDANIGGANPNLSTSSQTAYIGVENAGLTLVNNSGSNVLTAQVPCSSTNPPTGTTCSVGSESVGVSFTIPRAGDVLACVSFGVEVSTGSGGSWDGAFQVVETPNNAQTILQEGKSRIPWESRVANSIVGGGPGRVCGTFNFTSAGLKTLRLMYETSVSGTVSSAIILSDASATQGQRDIHWEVYPINQNFNAPIIVGSVTSNSSGGERIERATLNCDGASSILTQSGSWVSSIGNIAAGACIITLPSGKFGAAPTCSISDLTVGNPGNVLAVQATSATSITVDCDSTTGTDCTSFDFNLLCMGAK